MLGSKLPVIDTPTRARVQNTKGHLTPLYTLRVEGDKIVLIKGSGMKLRTMDEITLIRVETDCVLDDCPCKGGRIEGKNKEAYVFVLDDNVDIEPLPN